MAIKGLFKDIMSKKFDPDPTRSGRWALAEEDAEPDAEVDESDDEDQPQEDEAEEALAEEDVVIPVEE